MTIFLEKSGPFVAPHWFSFHHESAQMLQSSLMSDHGKTTLVDRLLQQSGALRENQRVCRARPRFQRSRNGKRGITILAKVTSILWQDTRINIVDTPGHADFGGEVERILNMVDGALVLVDAAEGPLPQTKFVVSKALKVGLKPIVIINKGRSAGCTGRPPWSNEVFDLFAALDCEPRSNSIFRSCTAPPSRAGWRRQLKAPRTAAWLRCSIWCSRHVAPPKVRGGEPFRMLGTILEANPYLGRIVTGRITSGTVSSNQIVKVIDRHGKQIEGRPASRKCWPFRGLDRTGVEEASAGDIVAIAGLPQATVSHTICAARSHSGTPLHSQMDPPTLAMDVPDQRLSARGDRRPNKVQRPGDPRALAARGRRQCRPQGQRIDREGIPWRFAGRGELQLGILIENDAPRGIRALRIGGPKVLLETQCSGRADGADRGSGDRRGTQGAHRHRRGEAFEP